jgi:hypothetical protein
MEHIDLITNLTTSSNCPLNCSYCVMDYDNKAGEGITTVKRIRLLDRIISFVEFLLERGYTIDMGQTNGEPLLNYKQIRYIMEGLTHTRGISYDVLSSFIFDKKNNHDLVFKCAHHYLDLFTEYNINSTFRWSVHMEYFDNTSHVAKHHVRLETSLEKQVVPIVMLNNAKDVITYVMIKKIIPYTEYHLIIAPDGTVPLLSELPDKYLQHLREAPQNVKGVSIVDRIINKDFSFTGLPCHVPPLINIISTGEVFNCPNNYYTFYSDNIKNMKSIFDIDNSQILEFATPPKSCPFSQCNVCTSDATIQNG